MVPSLLTDVKPFNATKIKPVLISGREVHPLIEGGKGIAVTNGESSGAFAAAGAVGTFSGVNADSYDEQGNILPQHYYGKTRRERHFELIEHGIRGGVTQAKIAYDVAGGEGRIHMNVLWEMGGVEAIVEGIMDRAKGLIHGITCGAGMPYKVAEIAEHYNVYYYPIVSSMRAFRALWKRSFSKRSKLLGGVVYEDPWKAGGHNGLSNAEDPLVPEDPYPRVVEIRKFMNEVGLNDVPIIMAGGVWHIAEWEHWLDNPDIGPVAFQFGTRPLLTQESPISDKWKQRLLTLRPGDVALNQFSPTGFYSSAVRNDFIDELYGRSERQIQFVTEQNAEFSETLLFGPRKRPIYVRPADKPKAEGWMAQGFDHMLKTPDDTVIFVTEAKENQIVTDQIECMGCLSMCRFSNWSQNEAGTTGHKADPRSYCIQKTLQHIAHSDKDIEEQLMFSGHNAFRFADDPFYANGFIPTVKQLVDRMMTGY
jgi:NAD(P)H-dependent flavin oxidoreductase YrpB (nitropropane dioxygenase family)